MKRALNKILDEIFKSTDDSISVMAAKAGLCRNTVYLLDLRATRSPQFRTVWLLAQAYGFTIELHKIRKMRKAA